MVMVVGRARWQHSRDVVWAFKVNTHRELTACSTPQERGHLKIFEALAVLGSSAFSHGVVGRSTDSD